MVRTFKDRTETSVLILNHKVHFVLNRWVYFFSVQEGVNFLYPCDAVCHWDPWSDTVIQNNVFCCKLLRHQPLPPQPCPTMTLSGDGRAIRTQTHFYPHFWLSNQLAGLWPSTANTVEWVSLKICHGEQNMAQGWSFLATVCWFSVLQPVLSFSGASLAANPTAKRADFTGLTDTCQAKHTVIAEKLTSNLFILQHLGQNSVWIEIKLPQSRSRWCLNPNLPP